TSSDETCANVNTAAVLLTFTLRSVGLETQTVIVSFADVPVTLSVPFASEAARSARRSSESMKRGQGRSGERDTGDLLDGKRGTSETDELLVISLCRRRAGARRFTHWFVSDLGGVER